MRQLRTLCPLRDEVRTWGRCMLSVLMHVFYTVCIVTLIWVVYGYSLAFTGGSPYVGGFSKAFLMDLSSRTRKSRKSCGT